MEIKFYSNGHHDHVQFDGGDYFVVKNGFVNKRPCLKVEAYVGRDLVAERPLGHPAEGFNGHEIGFERYPLGFKSVGLVGLLVDGEDAEVGVGILGKSLVEYDGLQLYVEQVTSEIDLC